MSLDQAMILGPHRVGEGTELGRGTIIGHPSKASMLKQRDAQGEGIPSLGAEIGARCIVRSGTVIYERSKLGNNVQTAHNVVIREDAVLGEGCVLGNGAVVREQAKLGRNVRCMENVVISEGAELGNDIFIGPNVTFTAGRYMTGALQASGKLSQEQAEAEEGSFWEGPSVVVEDEVRIGANAVILAGVTLGRGCVVAAGTVVSSSVEPGALVAGNPGRVLRRSKQ